MKNRLLAGLRGVNWTAIAFFPLSFFYMEAVLLLVCRQALSPAWLLYIFLFSAATGIIAKTLASIGGRRLNTILSFLFLLVFALIIGTQIVYYGIFSVYTTLSALTHVTDVARNYYREAFIGIGKSLWKLFLLLIPLIILTVFRKKLVSEKKMSWNRALAMLLIAVAVHLGCIGIIALDNAGIISCRTLYYKTYSAELSVPRFGMISTLRLEVRDAIRSASEKAESVFNDTYTHSEDDDLRSFDPLEDAGFSAGTVVPNDGATEERTVYTPNILNIHMGDLIKNAPNAALADMHRYFRAVAPTMKNEYTGMFEGYNLVWIVAEGFSSLALDKAHTPTLTKMADEGFVFNNFYNPIWGVSTSDGEYVATTGLIPKSGVWSYKTSGKNSMPFAFGNMFSELGYKALAYHDHTYTYYGRDISYPNMGYTYKGVGNGLDIEKTWPESDLEMMEKTVPEYAGDDTPFIAYYMTVSGHLNYNFSGNMMSAKHREEVEDLSYSEGPRAYIACQMEFDQAVEYLINELDRAGKLDRTVIVISGDHYPYGLAKSEMEELHGGPIEENFEMYRSTLMIWNSKMERTEVDKYCSSLDIMPTLANLFGLRYDSRLIMGRDILSDSPALVIFLNRSFITEYGRYDARKNVFIPNENAAVEDGYAAEILKEVNDKFMYSAKILENDYYSYLIWS